MGLRDTLWIWFKSYLTNRSQVVRVNQAISSQLPVLSGVPQGSILGPLLFLIFINDLPDCVKYARMFIFADDTKLLLPIRDSVDSIHLQSDIHSVINWSKSNNINFNDKKFVLLSFENKSSPPTSYNINNTIIPPSPFHRDLGVYISNDLSWTVHYSNITAKAYQSLSLIRRTFGHSPSIAARKKLYIYLIRSQLTYCSPLWRPHLIKDILLLESVQRRATKFILNDYSSDYKSRLTSLKLLPLMMHYELLDLSFFIRALHQPNTDSFNIFSFVQFCNLQDHPLSINSSTQLPSTIKIYKTTFTLIA